MNDVLPEIGLKGLDQLDTDQNQQEKREDLDEALHRDEKPWRRPDFLRNQQAQMRGGKRYHDDQHNSQHESNKLLSPGQKGFHIVSIP